MTESKGIFQKLLGRKLPDGPAAEELKAMRLPRTYENAVCLQIVKKAAGGDFSAAKYVLEAMRAEAPEDAGLDEASLQDLPTAVLRRMAGGEGGKE